MRKIDLVTLATFGAMFAAGCGPQPGDEPGLIAQALVDPMGPGGVDRGAAALDGRAAAAGSRTGDAPSGGATSGLAAWYTGHLDPGAQQHWVWNNAGSAVYKVGLAPSGTTTTASACQHQVIRSWDVQQPSGEREFHFIVENTGAITCGTNVLLQSQAAVSTWSTGTIAVGATQSWTWNNANPLTAAHFVNVSPTGASGVTTCELEVTRSWYSQQPSGERRFSFYVKNVGTIACGGTVLLAVNTNANSSWSTGTINPGGSVAWFWTNANPHNRVYVPGVSPLGATVSTACQLELLPGYYQEVLNVDHTIQRRYYIGVKNVGTISCSGTVLLNYLDPNNTNPLPVNLDPQQTNMWCWAASAEMVMTYLGVHMSQCEQANDYLGRTDCCNNPVPNACVQGGWPQFGSYGFSSNMVPSALSWTDLKAQIDTNHAPYAFSWHWNGGGGHMMAVIGYKVINGQNWVTINDPWEPTDGSQRDILYSDYVSGSTYTHWRDYYNVVRN